MTVPRTPEQLAETVRAAFHCTDPCRLCESRREAIDELLARLEAAERERNEAQHRRLDDYYETKDAFAGEETRVKALQRERDDLGPYFVRDMARIAGLPDDASMDAIAAVLAVSRGTPEAKETE